MGMTSNEYFKEEKEIYFHFIHLEVENCCCSKRIIKTRQTRSAACLLACLPVHQPGWAHQCNSKNDDNTQGRLLSSAVCVPIPKTKNSKMTNDNNKMLDMSLRVIYTHVWWLSIKVPPFSFSFSFSSRIWQAVQILVYESPPFQKRSGEKHSSEKIKLRICFDISND